MVRDPSKDEAYLSKWADFIQKIINKDINSNEAFPRIEGRAFGAYDVVQNAFQLCVFLYSRGDTIESMRPAIWQWVRAKEIQARVHAALPPEFAHTCKIYERLTLDTVYDALTMLAFGIALRFDARDKARLLRAIGHVSEDALIDRAAQALGSTRPVAAECKYPKVYQNLLKVWNAAPDQRPAALLAYGKEWKQKIKPIYWSNSLEGAEGAYFGYWCFDVALTAMLLDIDDQALHANPYYPKDLVAHYRQHRTG